MIARRFGIAKPAKADVSLGRLSNFLGFRLRRVQNKLSRDFHLKTAAWGLRAGMFSALEVIAANPGISQTILSREVGLDKSVMVALIDELEARGWVLRTRSEKDRRRYQLTATGEGRTVLDTLFADMDATEQAGLASLTQEERDVISRALDKVYRAYVSPPSRQPISDKAD
jgi:DNA-binding MarR family transcriptional regulator